MCGIAVYTGKEEAIKRELKKSFDRIQYRGPDTTQILDLKDKGWFGFHRLSIMDLSSRGDQPFKRHGKYLVCNGEVYNYTDLKMLFESGYQFISESDCEVILPMVEKLGIEATARSLDAEFAFVLYDEEKNTYLAARDCMGIRPLFYGVLPSGDYLFASECKVLIGIVDNVKPFPPGHFFDGTSIQSYMNVTSVSGYLNDSKEKIQLGIRRRLEEAIIKRLSADAPIGYLLSGGLDSSLVCAIAAKHSKQPIKTFAIGIKDGPIDTKYARIVADYIGSDHTEVLFTKDQMFEELEGIIEKLETYDITTIRASVGMHLLCKYIRQNTDIKVLLTGEVSDELFGYKYTDFAPSEEAFQNEAQKRVEELYMYDVLRADRCISSASLEARVPFGDKEFVSYVMHIPPALKMNTTGTGKYLLRKSFEGTGYLPDEILWREKAAFSDAVGHSMVDYLKEKAEELYTNEEFDVRSASYKDVTPITKEALWYRETFDKYYSGKTDLIKGYWMPNQTWENCAVSDPSARVLPNYGASGE